MSSGAIDLGRRKALQLGGFSLAFVWLGAGKAQAFMSAQPQPGDRAMALADGHPTFAPNAFIRIDTAGPVRLVMGQVEMGQGIYTGACALLAEELDIGMDQIKIEHAPPSDELYGVPVARRAGHGRLDQYPYPVGRSARSGRDRTHHARHSRREPLARRSCRVRGAPRRGIA